MYFIVGKMRALIPFEIAMGLKFEYAYKSSEFSRN